jgi:hypothetical protein
LDKRVVYLDQFAVSELYKTKTKTRRAGAPHEQFWQDCYALANRAYLRQQVIFPGITVTAFNYLSMRVATVHLIVRASERDSGLRW